MSTSENDRSGASGTPDADPTQTYSHRSAVIGWFNARWRSLRGDIRAVVEENDALGIASELEPRTSDATRTLRPESFGTSATPELLAVFREWLLYAARQRVLEPMDTDQVRSGNHWTAQIVDPAVASGIARATTAARRAGYSAPALSETPPSEIRKQRRYQQILSDPRSGDQRKDTYDDVAGAVSDVVSDLTETLRGALEGEAAVTLRELADTLVSRVRAIGQTRGAHISNAAVVRTVNLAALNRYQELGIDRVRANPETRPEESVAGEAAAGAAAGVATGGSGGEGDGDSSPERVRWQTAGDRRVCPQCAGLAGDTYLVSAVLDGDAPMPVRDTHPGCRCLLVPAS